MKKKKEGYQLIKRSFRKLFSYKVASYCLALIGIIISLLLINYMKTVIDTLQADESITYLVGPIGLLCGLYLLFTVAYQFVFRKTQIVGRNEILIILYKKLQSKKLSFFRNHNSGELISLINNEGGEVGSWLSYGVLGLFNLFTVLILNIGMMAYYNINLTILICVIIFVFYISTKALSSFIAKLTTESFKVTGIINRFLLETLKSEPMIHTLKKHTWFIKKFSGIVYEGRYPIDKKRANFHAIYMSIFLFLSVLLPIIIVVVGALFFKEAVSAGTLVAFYALTAHIQEPIQTIPELFSMQKSAVSLAENLLPIMQDDIGESEKSVRLPHKIDKLSIDIDSFSYAENDDKLLSNVNFNVALNDIVIIKGNSGAGKSTLLDLIMGFLKSPNVNIVQGNIDLSDISDDDRWRHMLLVSQMPLLFEGSLKENLLIGDNFSKKELDEAIYAACLEEFLSDEKMAAIVGGDLDGISGGQKQRIGLARMLLRKPDLLILDEPTSALDGETSSELVKRLTEFATKNNMILLIASHKNDFDDFATSIIEIR